MIYSFVGIMVSIGLNFCSIYELTRICRHCKRANFLLYNMRKILPWFS
uniref:Uncharacterized protein n=1 Tax=Arundo donax TaxID=35708 RepID=A0A0A9ALZ7_ARUDO